VQDTIQHATEPADSTLVDTEEVASGKPPPIPFLSEEDEDLHDALSPIYDQLVISKAWWILEVLPMRLKNKKDSSWFSEYSINMGKGRHIPKQHGEDGVKVHRSVQIRMEAEELIGGRYKPKADLVVKPTWIA